MAHDLRTMQGMSYRRAPSESLSGCKYLRYKAFLVFTLGILLVVSFFISHSIALLIVGLCVIILGVSLFFMDFVARKLGKERAATETGGGVNRSWNRIRRERLLRRYQHRSRRPSSTRRSEVEGSTSDENDRPPTYETSISIEELMRCPEPSNWTYLPSEPPPEYFPPTTDLDSNDTPSSSPDHGRIDQSEAPVYSISQPMNAFSFTLPTYEQALSPTSGSAPNFDSVSSESVQPTEREPNLAEETECANNTGFVSDENTNLHEILLPGHVSA